MIKINILMDVEEQKQIKVGSIENEGDEGDSSSRQSESQQQVSNDHVQSLPEQGASNQQSEDSPPIVAAIKTMKFREKRGSNMQDLMKGKIVKDQFWDRNCALFGGDLRQKADQQDESDYEASSSGRDEFDSDFDLTDSYPGKRGRKKGQKVKRRIKRQGTGRPRGRPRKIQPPSGEDSSFSDEEVSHKKEQRKGKKEKKESKVPQQTKKIYKPLAMKNTDYFIVLKATVQNKRGPKPKIRKEISSGSQQAHESKNDDESDKK